MNFNKTKTMLEIKEFSSGYHSGLYVEEYISKEVFLKALLEHPKVRDYLNEWPEEVRPTITINCIEHCNMIFNNNTPVRVNVEFSYDYEPTRPTEIENPVTYYDFWMLGG